MKSKTKQCQNCKAKFTIEPEDFEFYKKIDVPEPTWCPDCRLQRRMIWRNETNLYKRKCDFSGKEIFSALNSNSPVKVYDQKIWYSDKWDPMEYGRDYDFNKTFLKQFKELTRKVPWPSRLVIDIVNSDYSMNASFLKDCYLLFDATKSENCSYGVSFSDIKDSFDGYSLVKCEICYQGFFLANCYKSFYSSHCDGCQEVIFCHNCVNCSNCFGCTNLRHKKYHIFNKPYTKQEYEQKLKEYNLGSFKSIQEIKQKVQDFYFKLPVKFMHGYRNNDVSGEYIDNSKNVKKSYFVKGSENLKYCHSIWFNTQDCYDYFCWGNNARLIYEGSVVGFGVSQIKFCFAIWEGSDMEYSINSINTHNLFGCVGLRHKQYCILNKQYTKEEYNKLIPKIKQHMNDMPYIDKKGRVYKYGEFFPTELSPFAYNETLAQEYFPLTKEQASKKGYTWYDKLKPEYKATIKANQLPDNIKDVDDSILKEVIECSSSNCAGSTVYRIIPTELKFYQKQNIPLPRLCPDCRHRERIKQRNPLKLWHRKCQCAGHQSDNKIYKNTIEHPHHKDKHCPNEFETSYSPDRKEIVYCEKCYNKEVG